MCSHQYLRATFCLISVCPVVTLPHAPKLTSSTLVSLVFFKLSTFAFLAILQLFIFSIIDF